jgi:hypothetical protein
MDIELEDFDVVKLNEVLGHLYLDLRKTDGKHYKTTSLNCLRYSLNRYLKGPFSIPRRQKYNLISNWTLF